MKQCYGILLMLILWFYNCDEFHETSSSTLTWSDRDDAQSCKSWRRNIHDSDLLDASMTCISGHPRRINSQLLSIHYIEEYQNYRNLWITSVKFVMSNALKKPLLELINPELIKDFSAVAKHYSYSNLHLWYLEAILLNLA